MREASKSNPWFSCFLNFHSAHWNVHSFFRLCDTFCKSWIRLLRISLAITGQLLKLTKIGEADQRSESFQIYETWVWQLHLTHTIHDRNPTKKVLQKFNQMMSCTCLDDPARHIWVGRVRNLVQTCHNLSEPGEKNGNGGLIVKSQPELPIYQKSTSITNLPVQSINLDDSQFTSPCSQVLRFSLSAHSLHFGQPEVVSCITDV